MPIIQTKCWIQKPVGGYYKDCLAIFGIDYKELIWAIFISLIAGFLVSFIIYFLYCTIKDIKLKLKPYLILSFIISLMLFIIIIILGIIQKSRIIY